MVYTRNVDGGDLTASDRKGVGTVDGLSMLTGPLAPPQQQYIVNPEEWQCGLSLVNRRIVEAESCMKTSSFAADSFRQPAQPDLQLARKLSHVFTCHHTSL